MTAMIQGISVKEYLCTMSKSWNQQPVIGILGGGQLGRMFIEEASRYDVTIDVLDPQSNASCAHLAHAFTVGDFKDYATVLEWGEDKDIITIEIENVNLEALKELESKGKKVYPQPHVLELIKDKGAQKAFYTNHQIPTAPFVLIEKVEEIHSHLSYLPCMQKLRTGGYDGKGVQPLRSEADLEHAFDAPSVLESWVDFESEIAVVVARNANGEMKTFPAVDMEFNPEANLVEFLFTPSERSAEIIERAEQLAITVAEKMGIVGVLAVEMFVLRDGSVLVNEVAPRPHNSGHHTIECCYTSQYEQHLRAIMNWPLGDTSLIQPAVMVNLLGEKNSQGNVVYQGMDEVLRMPGVYVHLYGKKTTSSFRKMGHVTILHESLEHAKSTAREVMQKLKVVGE
jgi:5-(carboxyamino)imidazole ribonucleotide synthase